MDLYKSSEPQDLGHHLKVTATGKVFVRGAVQESPSTRSSRWHQAHRILKELSWPPVRGCCLPLLPGPNEVEIAVKSFGLTDPEAEVLLATFVGSGGGKKIPGYSNQKTQGYCGCRYGGHRLSSTLYACCGRSLLARRYPPHLRRVSRSWKDRNGRSSWLMGFSLVSPLFPLRSFLLTLGLQVSDLLQFKLSKVLECRHSSLRASRLPRLP